MSWGVCGRMCKLLILGFVETVAVGFSSDNLYSGPSCLLGALISGEPFPDSKDISMRVVQRGCVLWV